MLIGGCRHRAAKTTMTAGPVVRPSSGQQRHTPLRWPGGKASASSAEDLEFDSRSIPVGVYPGGVLPWS